ncbi:DUF3492 domain-containing protein [Streptomyces radicis]|uniref:D-inositol 3-phosphate glycosyltransferase n=1 Tax=Streptomyces radicis TaxID=1750517 RepID=A0A3A9W836_9ACTN|nr:DUF3492 domain-containing protein [Streptomyces radicis]RKN09020.1 DUF3492 domain-containing protein [Streptomyces radicis]RKN22789.1 DUF3492 domain-containing protein [Streptomyces radicis]
MRVALLTEGGYPYARGESVAWCDRLLHGLTGHDFDIGALSRGRRQERGPRRPLPPHVRRVRTAPLWGPPPAGRASRAGARRFAEHFAELTAALCPGHQLLGGEGTRRQADRFAHGLHGLADAADAHGGLGGWLRSERALRILEAACRARGAPRALRFARVADLLAVAERLERALRPLSLDWYGPDGLDAADLCHAVGGGPAALAGLLARRRHGTPLLVTERRVRVREHYLAGAAAGAGAPVRALLGAFQVGLAREIYASAALITPGDALARRWQERCGAAPERLRTVYPGLDARPFDAVARARGGAAAPALVWVGRPVPEKDLVGLLHAFHLVRAAEPGARLWIVSAPAHGRGDGAYLARCRALAARLFPAPRGGPGPVAFAEVGDAEVPGLADAYARGGVVVLSSAVEGFPVPLIEAMFSGGATVSTDAGAVAEVVGGTGLVVPPRDPRALAEACLALLRDPERRARLGAAARARALELFTVERDVAAFGAIYRELGGERQAAPRRPARARETIRLTAVGGGERA